MPFGTRSSALGPFALSPHAPSRGHFGGNRAPERNVAAAQGFNAVPGPAPRPLGQGFSPLGPNPHVALGPGDFTVANGLYDNSHGVGQQPAALPPSPIGYGAAYSPSDACKPYSVSFICKLSLHAVRHILAWSAQQVLLQRVLCLLKTFHHSLFKWQYCIDWFWMHWKT